MIIIVMLWKVLDCLDEMNRICPCCCLRKGIVKGEGSAKKLIGCVCVWRSTCFLYAGPFPPPMFAQSQWLQVTVNRWMVSSNWWVAAQKWVVDLFSLGHSFVGSFLRAWRMWNKKVGSETQTLENHCCTASTKKRTTASILPIASSH